MNDTLRIVRIDGLTHSLQVVDDVLDLRLHPEGTDGYPHQRYSGYDRV